MGRSVNQWEDVWINWMISESMGRCVNPREDVWVKVKIVCIIGKMCESSWRSVNQWECLWINGKLCESMGSHATMLFYFCSSRSSAVETGGDLRPRRDQDTGGALRDRRHRCRYARAMRQRGDRWRLARTRPKQRQPVIQAAQELANSYTGTASTTHMYFLGVVGRSSSSRSSGISSSRRSSRSSSSM